MKKNFFSNEMSMDIYGDLTKGNKKGKTMTRNKKYFERKVNIIGRY